MYKLTSEMQLKPFDPAIDDASQFSDGALMLGPDGKMYKALSSGNNPAYELLHDLTIFVTNSALVAEGYQTSSDVSSAISTALADNATQTWVSSNYYDKTSVYTKAQTGDEIEKNRELVSELAYTGVTNPTFPTNFFSTSSPYYESMEIASFDSNATFRNGDVETYISTNKHNTFRCKIINTNAEGTITISLNDTTTNVDGHFVIPQDKTEGQTSFDIPGGKIAEIFWCHNGGWKRTFCVLYS